MFHAIPCGERIISLGFQMFSYMLHTVVLGFHVVSVGVGMIS
jgi:hypothetical protein